MSCSGGAEVEDADEDSVGCVSGAFLSFFESFSADAEEEDAEEDSLAPKMVMRQSGSLSVLIPPRC